MAYILPRVFQQGRLVQVLLNPLRLEAEVGLAFGMDIQRVLLAKGFHRLAQHPGEWHRGRRVGRVAQRRWLEEP